MIPVHVETAGVLIAHRLADVERDETHARFDQFAAEQVALAPMAKAITLPHLLGLSFQVEGLARGRIGEHILGLQAQRGHGLGIVIAAAAGHAHIEVAEQIGPILEAAFIDADQSPGSARTNPADAAGPRS